MRTNDMHEELQALIARALVEPSFCAALLNGRREDCLEEFRLTVEERAAARDIEAPDLQSYARSLHAWMERHNRPAPVVQFTLPRGVRAAVAA
jgi:hypothetical protein